MKCECCNNKIIKSESNTKCECEYKYDICYWCYMENGYICKKCQRDIKIKNLLSQ